MDFKGVKVHRVSVKHVDIHIIFTTAIFQMLDIDHTLTTKNVEQTFINPDLEREA